MARFSKTNSIKIVKGKLKVKNRRQKRNWSSVKTPLNNPNHFLANFIQPNQLELEKHVENVSMDINHLIENEYFQELNVEAEPLNYDTSEWDKDLNEEFSNIFTHQIDAELYADSRLSVNESSLLIVSFISRYSLTREARKDLVNLIHQLIPFNNNMPKSYNKVEAKVFQKKNSIKEIKYCINCQYKLDEAQICDNESCKNYDNKQIVFDTFHFVDIKDQLTDILSTYWGSIERYSKRDLDVLDFINSNFYQKQANTLQLCLYTDGVPVFKNPSRSAWPVFASIVELPPTLRESRKTKIIAGVWFGRKGPTSDILFEDIIKNINSLEISINYMNRVISNKFKIYGFEADTPGKAKGLNMKGHKGYFSCTFCLIPGKVSRPINLIFLMVFNDFISRNSN